MENRDRCRIFGMAKQLNMSNEELHLLCEAVTGCDSIKALDKNQTAALIAELQKRSGGTAHRSPRKSTGSERRSVPGMMSVSQQGLAWRFIYRLEELDGSPSKATPGERMCGAIKKILGITADVKEPFKWISFDDGVKLIETLKRYVRSAERRAQRNGTGLPRAADNKAAE